MEDRFKEWETPEIIEGELTKWNWMVQGKKGLKLGKKTDIGAFTYINARNGVEVGDNVEIGSHCSIYSISTIDNKQGEVTLNKNCKIGSHSIVMPGVTIGENSIVGACSFVNSDIPPNVLAYGVPAKIIKPINKKEKKLCIVHCIDTEGPLYESLEATFQRIKSIFSINLFPNLENLEKLREKKIPLEGQEEEIARFLKKDLFNYCSNWEQIKLMLDTITSNPFRNKLKDSFGNSWIYNWFCLDHAGFTGENPRKRDLGFHKVFDFYKNYLEKNTEKDIIQWHFHPLSIKKDAHRCGVNYFNAPILTEILARKIIDRKWFPSAFRPGFHTERPDSNWFLEQWIPFDYANQSTSQKLEQPDLSNGKFGDWRKAPKEWKVYHPSIEDYQKEGFCKRWIARCLNINSRLRQISQEDVIEAFERANSGIPTLLSFTNHDFRNMEKDTEIIMNLIKEVSEKFPEVKFEFCNAVDAFRKTIGIKEFKNPGFQAKFIKKEENFQEIEITCQNEIFGVQPFFAIKTNKGEYLWQNLDFIDKNKWGFTFNFDTIFLEECEKIGIAANSPDGTTEVLNIDLGNFQEDRKIYNLS